MSIDNRTEINDCGAGTLWTGDDAVTVTTLSGLFYEGSASLSTQFSDSDQQMHTTEDSLNTGTFSFDWSDSTLYMIIKDNLQETQTLGGVKFVIGDAVDLIGYEVGGSDVTGIPLATFFFGYRLDVSNSGAFTAHVFSGAEGDLAKTAVTRIGYGTNHASKAQGPTDNAFMDGFRFIANDTPALTINGGTSGTPETLVDVSADDITNGWGMVSNPVGDQFFIAAPVEFGEDTTNTDSYFRQLDSQIFLLGTGIGVTHFNMLMLGGTGTGTRSFELDNCLVINVDTRANWEFEVTDHDEVKLTDTTFIDGGTMNFPVQSVGNKFMTRGGFTGCDQVYFNTMDVDGAVFSSPNDVLGGLLWDEDSDETNQDDLTFNSAGTGHAIELNLTGDGGGGGGEFIFSISGYTFNGYESGNDGSTGNTVFIVDNNNDNDVTINHTGTVGSISYERAAGYTGTVALIATVTLTVTVENEDGNAVEGARVHIQESSGGALVTQGETNASGIYSDSTFNFGGDLAVLTKVRLKGFKNFRTAGTIINTGISVGVTLADDDIVDLP